MADTTFPSAPSFADATIPAPPPRKSSEDVETYVNRLFTFLQGQYLSLTDMQSSIASGWLIDTVRILNLEAGTITSGSIFTQDLYVGDDQLIRLGGPDNVIEVKDQNNTVRTRLGTLGAGTTNWGQEWWDSSGTLIMSVGDTVFINGGIIQGGTIIGAALVNATITGSKIGSQTIGDSNMAFGQNASKLTVGTLTLSSAGVSLDVINGGNAIFRNGGDLLMRAGATDFSYINFQNSGGSTQGSLRLDASGLGLVASGSTALQLTAGSGSISIVNTGIINIGGSSTSLIRLGLTSNTDLIINGRIASQLLPDSNNLRSLGQSTLKWAHMWTVVDHVGDIEFDNGWRWTEADKVDKNKKGTDGLYLMDENWEKVMYVDRKGHLKVRGDVSSNWVFRPPTVARREAPDVSE